MVKLKQSSFAEYNCFRIFGEFVNIKWKNVANEAAIDPRNYIAQIFSNLSYCWSTLNLVR